MKHQTGGQGGRVFDFYAGLPEVWSSNPGGKKMILFVYIYCRYLINAMLLYIEFLCVLLIMISSVQFRGTYIVYMADGFYLLALLHGVTIRVFIVLVSCPASNDTKKPSV